MPAAYCLIRSEPVYRREAFEAGLRAAGYQIRTAAPGLSEAGNVMVGWNRYGVTHELATRFEAAGGTYLCAENAYIWTGGVSPHHLKHRPAFALAVGWHNDASVVQEGQDDRWSALGVTLKPWRADGEHILVCPNRPFGAPGRAMPGDWVSDVVNRLRKVTNRPIRVRPHPQNSPPVKPLADDLAGAWACVIWSSSAGVHALVAGVPVICEAPKWIIHHAALGYGRIDDIEHPCRGPRLPALQRLAHAQFSVEEIASGEPFTRLLRGTAQAEVAAVA